MSALATAPDATEYAEYYATYVSKVPPGDVLAGLRSQRDALCAAFEALPPERHGFRYAPDKWTLRDLLAHLIDAEWIFTVRALRFARGDDQALPGIDQDVYARGARAEQRSMASLLSEFRHLRSASLELFASLDDEALLRGGEASGAHVSVRGLVYIIAGHTEHHLRVAEERYGLSPCSAGA